MRITTCVVKEQLSKLTLKNVLRIRKKTFCLQFCIGTPEGHQKSIFNTPKVKKKTKIHMGSIRQSLQAQPKNIKKLSKQQINQSK
jgi:hypothetical protein